MELADIAPIASALSPWAHLASIRADGTPDVVPVHPAWLDGELWVMTGATARKVRNIEINPNVALHWQVTEAGDGMEVWGQASVHTDSATKNRLWTGVFDYDLNLFAPDGPDGDFAGFIKVRPTSAVYVKAYGMGGTDRWSAAG